MSKPKNGLSVPSRAHRSKGTPGLHTDVRITTGGKTKKDHRPVNSSPKGLGAFGIASSGRKKKAPKKLWWMP
jgi:hypothetical protein